jgi:thiol:disulfide interchange protein
MVKKEQQRALKRPHLVFSQHNKTNIVTYYFKKYTSKKTYLTMVNNVASMTEWGTLMETSKEKLVVVDFTATWCVTVTVTVDSFIRSFVFY